MAFDIRPSPASPRSNHWELRPYGAIGTSQAHISVERAIGITSSMWNVRRCSFGVLEAWSGHGIICCKRSPSAPLVLSACVQYLGAFVSYTRYIMLAKAGRSSSTVIWDIYQTVLDLYSFTSYSERASRPATPKRSSIRCPRTEDQGDFIQGCSRSLLWENPSERHNKWSSS